MIRFIKLYSISEEEERQLYFQKVKEGLMKPEKELSTMPFNYDAQGDKYYSQSSKFESYFSTRCEEQILLEQLQQIFQPLKNQEFNLVELGPGNGDKTLILLEKASKFNENFTYIGVDMSDTTNIQLGKRLEHFNFEKVIITGEYLQGIEWIHSNSKKKNIYFWLGNSISNMEIEEFQNFCQKFKKYLKKQDVLVVGIDYTRDPGLLQGAYFDPKQSSPKNLFSRNNLAKINRDLEGNFNLEQYFIHAYFDPKTRYCRTMAISNCDQTVTIRGLEFKFKNYQIIGLHKMRKWLGEDIKQIVQILGMAKMKTIIDSQKLVCLEVYCLN